MKSRYFFILAAFISFLLSVSIWFLTGKESQAIFVGICASLAVSFLFLIGCLIGEAINRKII